MTGRCFDLPYSGLRLFNVAALMVFCLSSSVTNELILVSIFKIKHDWTRKRDALSFGKQKKRQYPSPIHLTHPFLSYLDASRPRSTRVDYYKLVINDLSGFIWVNNYQVIENYKLPVYKISSKLSFYIGGWRVYYDWGIKQWYKSVTWAAKSSYCDAIHVAICS